MERKDRKMKEEKKKLNARIWRVFGVLEGGIFLEWMSHPCRLLSPPVTRPTR